MSDPRILKFNTEADKIISHLHSEFAKLQTGRASAALVEDAMVDAYGQMQPLKAVAGITIEDARSIVVQPWDRSVIGNIEKALTLLDLGTSPVNDGVVLRLNLPPMTEERREQMKKLVGKIAEEARISIRQQRQEVHDDVKGERDEDRKYTLIEELDKATKMANDKIEESMKKKEEEVMTV